jgi:iron complex transport system substrate-binding protein
VPVLSGGFPRRIVCLTEETTETLYLLGEQDRIVGISGYTVRPPEARREKALVSAFLSAKFDKIDDLKPDLVLAFSDLQADLTRELIRRGHAVFTFNQRSVEGIFEMIGTLARLVRAEERGERLISELRAGLKRVEEAGARLPRRPSVFFEEWADPLISGIRWVEELVFPELSGKAAAKDRIVTAEAVAERAPELVLASWCGRKVDVEKIRARRGWEAVPAVVNGQIREIKSADILQPGPAALTDGLRQIHDAVVLAAGNPHHGMEA